MSMQTLLDAIRADHSEPGSTATINLQSDRVGGGERAERDLYGCPPLEGH